MRGLAIKRMSFNRVYGYTAIQAYQVYNDPNQLQIAETVWNTGNTYTLSMDQITAGKTSVKNFTLVAECQSG
jgi:hypothetical protein